MILLFACFCSSCTLDYNYRPPFQCFEKTQKSTEDIRLLYPQTAKLWGWSVRDIKPRISEVSVPDGFDISPMEISGSLPPRKYSISIYADSKDYYVMFGFGKRKPSLVREYGFRVNGITGETALPPKYKPYKYSLPLRDMKGFRYRDTRSSANTDQ